MEVCKLKPTVKNYLWGGNYFQQFGKGLGLDKAAECWELSMQQGNESFICSGKDSERKISDVLTANDIGPVGQTMPFFPLLIKLIDAKDNLSVQVHPSDEYALKHENSFGKSEMWHIISHEPGAGLYVGFNDNYDRETIEKALNDATILKFLNFIEVQDGDSFTINPGTIHAIGKGVRLIEIQQNSNLTYRLYDYLRKDSNGNYRELHIEKALNVIDYSKYEVSRNKKQLLSKTQYFEVSKFDVNGELELNASDDSFASFTFLDGEGTVNGIAYSKYDTFFVPFGKKAVIKGKGTIVYSIVK